MKKEDLIIYDFDGTLYNGDSFLDFFFFIIIKKPWVLFMYLFLPVDILNWKMGRLEDGRLKEKMLRCFKNDSFEVRSKLVKLFWKKNYNKIFSWVYDELKVDIDSNAVLICISASPDFLLKDIVKSLGFDHLISTNFYNEKGMLNLMSSKNCKGEEKVLRLKKWANEKDINFIIKKMVSDSFVDLPLFRKSEKCFIVRDKQLNYLEV